MNLMNGNGNGGATQQQQQQQHSVGGMGIGQTPGFAGALPLRLSWAMCSSSASAAASSSSSAASATGSAADTSNHHHTRGDVAPPRFGHSCTVVDSALWGSELVVVYGADLGQGKTDRVHAQRLSGIPCALHPLPLRRLSRSRILAAPVQVLRVGRGATISAHAEMHHLRAPSSPCISSCPPQAAIDPADHVKSGGSARSLASTDRSNRAASV